ncbi:SGNH/GDSL hydrolase family protein [Flavobacterium branchiophilum]|uniref:GDSL-like lipase/acylhydrolase family protein n=1 Tax=Flavobacterium branchiophilum TaxID=55197 RepID=A0A2H3KYK0_9FLAO|nr:hypothetical protein [Flavobacterium branchiophilum]PDS26544.1 hypothetical protein B0A77_02270 [Flavobacterium branchiophilum]
MNPSKSYFIQSFLIVFLAAIFFIGLKNVLPKKIFSEKTGLTQNVLIDSMLLEAFNAEKKAQKTISKDTLNQQNIHFFETNGIAFPSENFENYKGYQYLIPFYEKLYQLETTKKGHVRIAYFGDSMTDGDMIVQDVRAQYQNQFGGNGVGFVAITSESAASRGSVLHEYATNWKTLSYLNVKNPSKPFGVNGHVFFANDTLHKAWVRYKTNIVKPISWLNNPTLFYGYASNNQAVISYTIGKDTISKNLTPHHLLNTLVLSQNPLKSLKVDFKKAKSIPIYGFNFDDGKGVHVDNFSQRGNSGIPISKFDVALMQSFHQKLNYDLIVLHYGTNVLNYGTFDYGWYNKSMSKVVQRLKECFPGTAILVISTADKATKYETQMKTDSAVVPLTLAQKRYALNNQAAFVNLYTLMGGDGSMTKWVEEIPVLANKDYTHFNQRGAKKVAGIIYNQLQTGYEQYKQLRKNKATASKTAAPKVAPIQPDSLLSNPNEQHP